MIDTTKNLLLIRPIAGLPHREAVADFCGDSRGVTVVCPKSFEKLWERALPGATIISRERMGWDQFSLPGGRVLICEMTSLNPKTKQWAAMCEMSSQYEQTIISHTDTQLSTNFSGVRATVKRLDLQPFVFQLDVPFREHPECEIVDNRSSYLDAYAAARRQIQKRIEQMHPGVAEAAI